jgi:hypothetical protein
MELENALITGIRTKDVAKKVDERGNGGRAK